MRKIAVLGLGSFGMRVACHLTQYRVEVIAFDQDAELVARAAEQGVLAVRLDITSEEALRSQNTEEVDVAVVALGEDLESSLLTTLLLKKLGVKEIIARAQSEDQAEILRLIGAHQLIQPENQAADHLVRKLTNPRLEDFIELDENHSIIQILAPASFVGKTLGQLRLRTRYRVNLVAIKRLLPEPETEEKKEKNGNNGNDVKEKPRRIIGVPSETDVIEKDDILVLVGADNALANLPQE